MKSLRNISIILCAAALVSFVAAEVHALPPPRPGLVDPVTRRFRTTGAPLPVIPSEVRTYRRASQLNGKYPYSPSSVTTKKASARPLAINAAGGYVRPLVILIDFADRQASASPSIANPSAYTSRYFGAGASDLSVKNYWEEVSYTRQGTNLPGREFHVYDSGSAVVGWLRAGTDADPSTEDFPTSISSSSQIAGVQTANMQILLDNVIAYLATRPPAFGGPFDFSPYVGPDGVTLQAVILHHPGYGQEDAGDPGDPYSHAAKITAINPSNQPSYAIVDYILVPSLQAPFDPSLRDPATDPLIGIGVIAHEMGHLFGLPDLYPASGSGVVAGTYTGVGVFDLMGYGLWGSNFLDRPDTPAHLSAWSKAFLGWIVPAAADVTGLRTLRPVEQYPDADRVYSNTAADPEQYFLVENRQTGGSWLFDRYLTSPTGPGAGLLIWQIDNVIIRNNLDANSVNADPDFRGVYPKEADGLYDLAAVITPPGGGPNDLALFFGLREDYFASAGQVFDRLNPSAAVNSAPIVDNTVTQHPFDFGSQVTMLGFSVSLDLSLGYFLDLSAGGGGGAAWRTFNEISTQKYPLDNTLPREPMRSNDILAIAFDSGNNAWLGSADEGIFRFLGTRFEFLTTLRGLPAGTGTNVAPVKAMAFEGATNSMWVGTDQGLHKMRDSGSGFRVQASYSTTLPAGNGLARLPNNAVQALAVRGGTDIKYVGTPDGLVQVLDGLTDAQGDDQAATILTGNATAIAIDDNGNSDIRDDVVWVGFASGDLYRSHTAAEGARADGVLFASDFKKYTLAGSPKVNALAVDKLGRLWIGTDGSGVLALDLGETLATPQPNLWDPYDFDRDGNLQPDDIPAVQVFLNTARGAAADKARGIAFQVTTDPNPVAWIGHVPNVGGLSDPTGGVTRYNANDNSVTIFRPEASVPPQDQVNGPASYYLDAAAADSAGNVWFGSTQPGAQGVSRFGNAGVVSLDKSNYVNTSAIATVTLQDDGLNKNASSVDVWFVRVTSGSDGVGFTIPVTETGPDTGVFQARFGFTNGPSEPAATLPLVSVASGNQVTVTYVDASPAGVRTATATWKAVYPFEDSLLINGGACFIATAAFGSRMAPEVRTFRLFRDRVLLSSGAGRMFVSLYYRLSPALAAVIARSPSLRSAARFFLAPASCIAGFSVAAGAMEKVAVAVILIGGLALLLAPPVPPGKRRRP